MNIRQQDKLLFVSAELRLNDRTLLLDRVVLDTGSAASIFATDRVARLGIEPKPDDVPREIRGIGGSEYVLTKKVDSLTVGAFSLDNLEIQMGGMDYGFDLDGILGLDFLLQVKAVIDLDRLELRASASPGEKRTDA